MVLPVWLKLKGNKASGKVAILGHRGIPNSYGGFETFAEELAERLVGFGMQVTVYCRSNYFKNRPSEFKGASLVYLPTIAHKILDTAVHTLVSVIHVLLKNTADVVIVLNVANAPFALLAKLFGKKIIFCVDGLDWQRKKWGRVARWYFKTCSYFAKLSSNVVVTDAGSVQEFYKTQRGTESSLIPYGTDIEGDDGTGSDVLKELKLENKKYFIYVSRFEPENNPLLVVKSYVASGSKMPLVMIGDNRYNKEFVNQIKAAANEKVIFLGYVFGSRYKNLVKNALAYIRAAEVGGISPAVIEAMGRGVCVVANDKSENREPLSDTGIFYDLEESKLSKIIRELSLNPNKAIELGKKAAQRAMIVYSWDRIAYEYVKLIQSVSDRAVVSAHPKKTVRTPRKKKVLITGAGGMLGQAVYDQFCRNYQVLATSRHPSESWLSELDVLNLKAFEKRVAEFRPDYIFHLAALTNLEECEKNLSRSYSINTLAVKTAAQLSSRYGAKLVYISSGNVFDGAKKVYSDNDEPNPTNVYGLTKHMGELMTKYYARDYLIIRPGWMTGGGPVKDKKFVAKIVEQIVAGKRELRALTDKFGTLSYTRDVAKNIELLLKHNAHGTYNMASTGAASRYEIAKEIVKILGYEKMVNVTGVDSNYFSHTFSTNRNSFECLANDRLIFEGLNLMRPWRESLKDYLKQDYDYAFNNIAETQEFQPVLAN